MKILWIDAADNVAVAIQPVQQGERLDLGARSLVAAEDMARGHKVAVAPIAAGQTVCKYGVPIGRALCHIAPGAWVHEHNMQDITAELCQNAALAAVGHSSPPAPQPCRVPTGALQGFARPDGSVGLRNIVLVVSTVTCANTVVNHVAWKSGAVPLTHERGCVEGEPSAARTRLALMRYAQNPNVSGVLVVGLGCEQIQATALAEAIGKDKPVHALSIQEAGGAAPAEREALAWVRAMQEQAEGMQRQPCSMHGLVVGVQCGGSDWTTAIAGNSVIGAMTDCVVAAGGTVLMSEVPGIPGTEHIVASRAVNAVVGQQIMTMVHELRDEFLRSHGQPIEAINPTPGNKAGGITSLVEKSMGNIKKMGTSPVQGVLALGQRPPHAGLWIVDNRANGPDPVNLSGFAMAGANVTVFSTGRGTPVGSPVMPVIKLTGNPQAYAQLPDIMDFNAGVVIDGADIRQTGENLFALLVDVANGRETRAEVNGNYEFAIPY